MFMYILLKRSVHLSFQFKTPCAYLKRKTCLNNACYFFDRLSCVNKLNLFIIYFKFQRGNPLLKSISNVPWEYDETIVPDYVMGRTTCALFLSLRYHTLKPDYIAERLKLLGKLYDLRVLLVQVKLLIYYQFWN